MAHVRQETQRRQWIAGARQLQRERDNRRRQLRRRRDGASEPQTLLDESPRRFRIAQFVNLHVEYPTRVVKTLA